MNRVVRVALVFAALTLLEGCFLFKTTKYHAPPDLEPDLGARVSVATLSLPGLELDKKSSRRFMAVEVDHPDVGAMVTRGNATYLLDASLGAALCRVDLGEDFATGAFAVDGIDAVFVLHHEGNDNFVSRVDPTTGAVAWTTDGGIRTTFVTMATNLMGANSTISIETHRTTYMAHTLADGREIQLLGLAQVKGDSVNRLVRIDASNGGVLADEYFQARRSIGLAELLVDFEGRRLLLLNRGNGDTIFETAFDDSDILFDADKVPPVGRWDGHRPSSFFWDLYPIVAGDDLWLSSRHVFHDEILGGGDFKGQWARISLDTGEMRPPRELKAALDYSLRNLDGEVFPVIMPVFHKHVRARAAYGFPMDGMTALAEDGAFSDVPLPEPCASAKKKDHCKYYWGRWFQDGGEVFAMVDGTLYGVDISSGQTRTVFESPGRHKGLPIVYFAPHAVPGYAMLQGQEDVIVVRLADGAEVDPLSTAALGGTRLLHACVEHDSGLPEGGLPEHFEEYLSGLQTETETHLLVPAVLRGGGTILVGFDPRQLQPEFWFPVGRVEEEERHKVHFWSTTEGDDVVVLAAQADATIKVYRLSH